ncbi:MAG TPA: hypothetical protein VL379_01255 [Pseudomonadales bacterium]|nr:hypothetical protein [Pseudomonadales bacterium]
MKRPVDRIVEKLGMPQLIDALAVRLSGADLTSLLLEVTRRRAAVVTPADLMKRYATDRFVAATTASFSALRRAEDAVLSACADRYEAIALAPLVPLGTHSAIATVDQNKVLTTIRNNEVAADPTNALALEAATRRTVALRADPKSTDVVRLAASQRVVRTQHVSGPGDSRTFSCSASSAPPATRAAAHSRHWRRANISRSMPERFSGSGRPK